MTLSLPLLEDLLHEQSPIRTSLRFFPNRVYTPFIGSVFVGSLFSIDIKEPTNAAQRGRLGAAEGTLLGEWRYSGSCALTALR